MDANGDGTISFEEWRYVFPGTGSHPRHTPQNGKMTIFTRPAALARQSLICCRDFLLFIPASAPNLRAVLTYFNAATHINAEGDVEVSDLDRINT
jgi:solute carrier family 25 phosphate transporter 23/24/25/41